MNLPRRHLLLAASALPLAAHAHHGWSSFDADRPIYLEGTVKSVRWQNPHAELQLEVAADLQLPANLSQRAVPAQTAPVDGKALLAKGRPADAQRSPVGDRTGTLDADAGLASTADQGRRGRVRGGLYPAG